VKEGKFDQPISDRLNQAAPTRQAGISYRILGWRRRDDSLDAVEDVVCNKPMHCNQPWQRTVATAAFKKVFLRATQAAAVGIGFNRASRWPAPKAKGFALRTWRSPSFGVLLGIA